MPNHLANETSPYLLQHVNNPVDWYPWGSEALALSKKLNKPIFLSIGYSACHWCHVMEHESFENEAIAKSLNEKFVCIKVDREERPDLDQLYMNAVQMMTGRGGWPMSVFLTPDLKPFYSGTYWPPKRSRGMPGFDEVIAGVSNAWETNREAVVETSDRLTDELAKIDQQGGAGELTDELIAGAFHSSVAASTTPTVASAAHQNFPRRWASNFYSATGTASATHKHSAWSPKHSTAWLLAAFTITSAAASPATPSTPAGLSRTSKKCSTTMPSLSPPT